MFENIRVTTDCADVSAFLCDLPDWHSKGNRRMWEHLMHVFAEREVTDPELFMQQVLAEYQHMTGCILSDKEGSLETHYVAALDFGGDGGGMVSDAFWLDTCLPVLQKRFSEI